MSTKQKTAVVSLSGGMDSTGLLMHLLANDYKVYGISFYYGQKHSVELDKLKDNLAYLDSKGYTVEHNLVDLSSVMGIFNSALTDPNYEVPEGHYAEDNMKATVVPNRNAIFSSIVYGYALSLATKFDTQVDICLGVHSGDHAIYPDCRPEFYVAIQAAFDLGNWDSEKVDYYLPYLNGDKFTILEDSSAAIDKLGLNFDTIFANTNTSYKPYPSGNSDYKSASSVERIEAFLKLGKKDPVQYEDETGPVDFEVAAEHVKTVLAEHV